MAILDIVMFPRIPPLIPPREELLHESCSFFIIFFIFSEPPSYQNIAERIASEKWPRRHLKVSVSEGFLKKGKEIAFVRFLSDVTSTSSEVLVQVL